MSTPSTKYFSKLAGHRVLVLGGTTGIGYAVAEAAVEHGAHVIVSSSKQENVTAAIESLKTSYQPNANGNGPHAPTGQICDLSQAEKLEENIESLLKFAAGESKINHIVVTAGDVPLTPAVSDLTADSIKDFGTVRFVSVLLIAKFIPRYMDMDRTNSFTLTGGVNTAKPMQGWSLVAGYGAALEGLVRGFTVDLKPLRVNLVAPGAVRTRMFDRVAPEQRDALLEKFRAQSTVGAVAEPEEVAEAYLYFMKDKFVTGEVMRTSGGTLLV